jgi:hypothetical protein
MSRETIHGGCHCGALAFEVALDLDAPTFRCNCSICTKSRAWLTLVPLSDFALSKGSEALSEYKFGPEGIAHCFCRHCGVKTHGRILNEAGSAAWVAVSLAALDLPPERLAAIPVTFSDGRHDAPGREPVHTSYL